jgi:hypothetical protein
MQKPRVSPIKDKMKDNLVRLLKTTPDRYVSKGTPNAAHACAFFSSCPLARNETKPSLEPQTASLNASGREFLKLRTTGSTSRRGRTRRWTASERAVRCRAMLCCSCQRRPNSTTRHAPTRACMLHISIWAARSNKKIQLQSTDSDAHSKNALRNPILHQPTRSKPPVLVPW